ncbi:MAG: beta-N-acetylhexosaminidase [Nitrosomonadales bacterium]|nr:beta-N-acetylhexosaminidase [Alphaproteobacteria bacterium]MBT6392448.1 beta-N-acetylhexosaminidase [Nitrosomonadales bacterium]
MLLGSLIIDLSGLSLSAPEQHLLTNPHIGGVIFFSRNFQSREQITSLTSDIRMIRPDLLICVDQEGGRVQRFRDGFTKIPPMKTLGEILGSRSKYAEKFIKDCGWLMASEIVACGIDFSFAPVLDLDKDKCQVIADRSFSDNPVLATKAAKLFIEGMHEAGMAATGKHFPGHGGVSADSHHETPLDQRSLEELRGHDLIPFTSLADSLDAIMPAHIIYPKIDLNAVGFSELWLKKILRQELKFDGIIFSDDLSMKGADIVGGYTNKAKAALQAGCDMVLVCNNRKGVIEVLDFLESYNWVPSARLSRMSRQVTLSWDSLIEDDRWKSVNAKLLALPKGK